MTTVSTQILNEGIKVIVNVKKPDGTAKDLTGATNLKIKIRSDIAPAGKSFNASFEGDPATGAVSCILGAGAIDAVSVWKAQAYYELGSFKGHTERVELFLVEDNLA
jgi:hypothetical protein